MKKRRIYSLTAFFLVIAISVDLCAFSAHAQEQVIGAEGQTGTETFDKEHEKNEADESCEETEEDFEETEENSEEPILLDTIKQYDDVKQTNEIEQILDVSEVKDVMEDSQIGESSNMWSIDIWNGDKNTEWEGKGTSDSPYLIKCAEDLAGISYQSRNSGVNFQGIYFKLANDIYINDVTDFSKWEYDTSTLNVWQSINNFQGVFQGENHTIYGLFCNSVSANGLFNNCDNTAQIKDLHVDKSLIINTSSGTPYVGGITGSIWCDPSAIIINCSFSGIIKCRSKGYVGGIVGYACSPSNTISVTIKGCKNYANISGGSSVGGIVGYANQDFHKTVISKCTNYGKICGQNISDIYVGGIVGQQSGDDNGELIIEQCNNLNTVSGGQYVGGILGYAYPKFGSYCTIKQCYNTGNIESSVSSGCAGGIIGISYANVSGQTNIQNCFNIGNVKATYRAGGLAGAYSHTGYYSSGTKRIQQSYNSGNVEAKYQDGIISTYTDSVFSDCFYLDSCCEGNNSIGKKMSESEMTEINSFTNYDFDVVWNMDNSINLGYPYLLFGSEGLPGKDSPSDGDNINQNIIDRVSEYTSDEIYAQFNAISESDYSYEVKFQMWLDLFTNYGITDVREGIKYLSNTTDKRYAYLNLTNSDMYCASNFQYMLDHTAKGWAMRAVLLADGLVFNGEINDWLDFTTHMETEYPGVKKYKSMLYDFMDATSQSIEMQSDIKLVSDLSKNVTGAAKVKADNLIEKLNTCSSMDEINTILKSNEASEVWAELSEKRDDEGNVVFSYKLDDSSGFGQFEKAMGYATKTISIVDMTVTDVLDLLTLDSKLAVYSQYKRFLKDIWSNTEYIPYQMRWAATLILNEIEEGYLGKIKDIAVDIVGQTGLTGMVKEAILKKVGASSFSSWLTVINIEAFFINKIADIGSMVKNEAYVEGYSYLANAFTKQLENSKQAFLSNKTEQNAWDFYYNYNILYRLRYKGEESYLAMTKVDGIAGLFSDYGYAVREEVVNDTLKMLKERCEFTFDAPKAIPESCQFVTKSVINCPVNVEVYTADGNLIATLLDGKESDITNNYGRFAVVYDSYSGDYIKVICLNSSDKFRFRIIGTDEGLVNMELAQAGGDDSVVYYFNNVPISLGMVLEADTEQITQQKIYNIDKDGDGVSEDSGRISIKDNGYVSVDSLSLNKEKMELEVGESNVLQLIFSPLEATDQSVFWLSDNPTVATVKDGKVTAVSDGIAKIYCTSLGAPDIVVSCEVTALSQMVSEQKYTITFNANGGKCDLNEMETDTHGKLTDLPAATREGYGFKGWFMGADDGEKVTEETIFDKDTTIYAQWIVEKTESNGIKKDDNNIVSGSNNSIDNTAPRTGDYNCPDVWFILMILSSTIILSYILRLHRRKKQM